MEKKLRTIQPHFEKHGSYKKKECTLQSSVAVPGSVCIARLSKLQGHGLMGEYFSIHERGHGTTACVVLCSGEKRRSSSEHPFLLWKKCCKVIAVISEISTKL